MPLRHGWSPAHADRMSQALVTDLYELNMAASYLRQGMAGPATFSLFVRALPPNRGFLVAAGLEDCLDLPGVVPVHRRGCGWLRPAGFDAAAVEAFSGLRFTGDVYAVPKAGSSWPTSRCWR